MTKKRTRESEQRKWGSPPDMAIVYDENGNMIKPVDRLEQERALAVQDAVEDMDEEKLRKLGILSSGE